MPVLARRRSYAEAVEGRRRLGRRVGYFLLFYSCFEILSGIILAAYSAGSACMSPTILPGELILATPLAYGPRTVFGKLRWSSLPERGDIVIADPSYAAEKGFWSIISDSFVRFVTFQRLSAFGRADNPTRAGAMIMRIIALPGDTLVMEDFVYKIKAADSSHFLTEFELSPRRYDIARVPLPEGWKDGLPGSGRMEARTLGPDEYFMDGDARSASAGSRLWGPVSKDRLLGKVLLRYWPFKRFGAP